MYVEQCFRCGIQYGSSDVVRRSGEHIECIRRESFIPCYLSLFLRLCASSPALTLTLTPSCCSLSPVQSLSNPLYPLFLATSSLSSLPCHHFMFPLTVSWLPRKPWLFTLLIQVYTSFLPSKCPGRTPRLWRSSYGQSHRSNRQ